MKMTLLRARLVTLAAAWLAASVANAAPLPGQIVIDPERPHALMRHGGKHLFLCGPGDPEDFLYRGTRNSDGTRSGDQEAIIRKLIEHGGNSIYMQAVRTHGGDAKPDTTHNPFVDSHPAKGLDERILRQWEQWFSLMDEHQILIYFFFYDDSARIWNTGDRVGEEERAFFEALVKRFKHHRNLIWIVGEEVEERYTAARVNALAEIIRAADDHGHVIGAHHLGGTTFKHWKAGGALTHFSMQLTAKEDAAHTGAIEARRKAEGRYQIVYSESTAMPIDGDGMRRHAWLVAMGGTMPLLLHMDVISTAPETLRQCRILQHFFERTDFHLLSPHDDLGFGETKYVLAQPGQSYIAYGDRVEAGLGIEQLPAGVYEVDWADCQTGKTLQGQRHTVARAGVRMFSKPAGIGAECAAWIRRSHRDRASPASAPPIARPEPMPAAKNVPPIAKNLSVGTVAGTPVYIQLQVVDEDGPGPYTYTVVQPPANGTLTGEDNDRTYTAKPGFVGTDRFVWKVNDGKAESRAATVELEVVKVGPRPK